MQMKSAGWIEITRLLRIHGDDSQFVIHALLALRISVRAKAERYAEGGCDGGCEIDFLSVIAVEHSSAGRLV